MYHCAGCGVAFSIFHTIDCNMVGLITVHHNDLRDGVSDLAGKDFTPTHVRDDPKIFTGRAVCGGKAKAKVKGKRELSPDKEEEKGGFLNQYLWTQEPDSIHYMCVLNTDAVSYQSKKPQNCLEIAE